MKSFISSRIMLEVIPDEPPNCVAPPTLLGFTSSQVLGGAPGSGNKSLDNLFNLLFPSSINFTYDLSSGLSAGYRMEWML